MEVGNADDSIEFDGDDQRFASDHEPEDEVEEGCEEVEEVVGKFEGCFISFCLAFCFLDLRLLRLDCRRKNG
jgi:hypothetical protein